METSLGTARSSRSSWLVVIAFLSFIVLSFPAGMIGVAWPSMRATFGLPLDALGTLLVASTIGHICGSFASGSLMRRLGVGGFLLASSASGALGLLGYVLAPNWWTLVGISLLTGLGAGTMDAGLNAYFAGNHNARLMNWLHASFGLGVTLGPLVMTAVLARQLSWRWGYVPAVLLQALMALVFLLTLSWWPRHSTPVDEEDSAVGQASPSAASSLRLAVVWLGMGVFFLISGTEAVAGNWAFSLFSEERNIPVVVAGQWVSIYWGSFTAGRILFGLIGDRLSSLLVLRANMLLAAVGAGLLWWNPSDLVSFLALALIGLALAPLFPLLVLETPARVGRRRADQVIGFQIGAAGVGLALLPAVTGVLATRSSLEVVGPMLLLLALAMLLLNELIWFKSK